MNTISPNRSACDRKNLARASVIVFLFGMLVFLSFVTEPPFVLSSSAHTPQRGRRVAIAIRDHTSPYLQWGTMLFSLPALRKAYHKVHYFNQRHDNDQKEHIIHTIKRSLQTHPEVDLFLLAHGNKRFLGWVRVHIERDLTSRLRLVYNAGCGGREQGPEWKMLGTETYVGHGGGVSVSPIFFFYFLRRWSKGYKLDLAIHEANWYTRNHLLLVGRFSFGLLNGPTMWEHTQATYLGNPNLSIDAPPAPAMLSNLRSRRSFASAATEEITP